MRKQLCDYKHYLLQERLAMAAFKRRAAAAAQGEAGGDVEDGHSRAELLTNESRVTFQTGGARTAHYMQYIKALNTQFTSWVQQQLKEHPHELWQEGIQDYLRHALKIQDDFKDVAALYTPTRTSTGLQLQAASSLPTVVSDLTGLSGGCISNTFGKSVTETKSNAFYSQPLPPSVTVPFSSAMPSGLPMLNTPGHVLAMTNYPTNNGNDAREDDDVTPEPSSPSLKRSEEPGVEVIHEIKCKLYIKGDANVDKAWKEMGMGNLTLKSREGVGKGTKEAKATVVVRNEVGRILLNALLYPNMKMNVQKNTVTGIFHSAETDIKTQGGDNQETDAVKARLYLFKLKTASDAEQLVEVINSNAPRGE